MVKSKVMVDDFDQLISRTYRRLQAQRTIPMSPGHMSGNELMLCAGAVLVREAAAMYRSQESAENFAREAITRDSDYIRQVGAAIGLDEKMVDSVIIENDCLPASKRLRGTLEHIIRLGASGRQ